MKTKIGYKIVYESGHKLYSLTFKLKYLGFKGSIRYYFQSWVFPRIGMGPLAVFEDKLSARTFLYKFSCSYGNDCNRRNIRLYECEYVPSRGIHLFWSKNKYDKRDDLPDGTVLAKSVKLLKWLH
jgi:sulfatase maturation enzyme AslB (radical SAM superfamily)